jgi:hypothetical protein
LPKSRTFSYLNWAVNIIINYSETPQIWSDISIAVPFTPKKANPFEKVHIKKFCNHKAQSFKRKPLVEAIKKAHLLLS